ncbi:hypothetical protein Mx4_p80 [Myxococcus phage Mx4]|nr:hypothetical protein Mx4_p80 [Myxococcus phage Mx4]
MCSAPRHDQDTEGGARAAPGGGRAGAAGGCRGAGWESRCEDAIRAGAS